MRSSMPGMIVMWGPSMIDLLAKISILGGSMSTRSLFNKSELVREMLPLLLRQLERPLSIKLDLHLSKAADKALIAHNGGKRRNLQIQEAAAEARWF